MTTTTTDVPAPHCPAATPLTPGQALTALFLANADRGANAANDLFVEELLRRRLAIQALASPSGR